MCQNVLNNVGHTCILDSRVSRDGNHLDAIVAIPGRQMRDRSRSTIANSMWHSRATLCRAVFLGGSLATYQTNGWTPDIGYGAHIIVAVHVGDIRPKALKFAGQLCFDRQVSSPWIVAQVDLELSKTFFVSTPEQEEIKGQRRIKPRKRLRRTSG